MNSAIKPTSGKRLSQKWNVKVLHALYRECGDWYHQLKKFPGALFDKNGYIIFQKEEDFRDSIYLRIRKDVNVPNGICNMPGYIRVAGFKQTSVAKTLLEGYIREVRLNRYERNRTARKLCLDHYGTICSICEKDLQDVYGITAKGIIHVHHITPLSLVGTEYIVDPINDLRPLCPNCHSVIHRRSPAFTIEEVKRMLL